MEAKVSRETVIGMQISVPELKVLVHLLSADDSFMKAQAEAMLPENHEELAEGMAETLRTLHDRKLPRDDE